MYTEINNKQTHNIANRLCKSSWVGGGGGGGMQVTVNVMRKQGKKFVSIITCICKLKFINGLSQCMC